MKPARLYGITEIAHAAGVPRDTVNKWRCRGQLPPPDFTLAQGPVWWGETVEPWIAARQAGITKWRDTHR